MKSTLRDGLDRNRENEGESNFIFSSRRRHTRYWHDWSSDVCSSDLNNLIYLKGGEIMSKVLELKIKDKTGQIKNTGKIEIKNQTEDKAELYFYGDIVSETWQSYWFEEDKCPQDVSDFLKELENSKDVDIYINSGGGSVFAGIAIYSMLKRHKGKKIVHVDGLAASIASVIALAGDEVIIPSYANFMIHNPLCF